MSGKSGSVRLSSITKLLKLTLHSVFTACPKQEFFQRFPNFTAAEQELLYRLYIETISWFPENVEEEFEAMCLDTQAGAVFDTVEQLLEEQSLDLLHNQSKNYRSNIKEVGLSWTQTKRKEIDNLTKMVEMAEKQKGDLSARLELLKSKSQEFSSTEGIIDKLRMAIVDYGVEHTLETSHP
ncbi:hypothetical protein Leryth_023318 [Lithospermum erythrorhizon]|nr:hypothetical protein Leryth_023318 [Lithospermum erythrorhizon]